MRKEHQSNTPRSSSNGEGPDRLVNSIGMELVRIEAGSFMMGQERSAGWEKAMDMDRDSNQDWIEGGTHTDWDEVPVHRVNISRPFYMATTEVTNAHYEQFDPEHKRWRGCDGQSKDDDEAVIFVSWHEAVAFCKWLSDKEGMPYRLPTEAEWEYACRAGTTTAYHTGNTLPEEYHRHQGWYGGFDNAPVSLHVGTMPRNAWGLHEMHGNVEEWCYDWYGPYEPQEQTDPVGRAAGLFRVSRGGSHNTFLPYLRSANRMGTLPEDRSSLIGFRVVMGQMPQTYPLPETEPPLVMRNVLQEEYEWPKPKDEPFFLDPILYVQRADGGYRMGWHNHQPGITWCPNGDLLIAFFTSDNELSRQMVRMATRLRRGREEWDPASPFFNPPDRNVTGCSLFHDGKGKLFFSNGLGEAEYFHRLVFVQRISTDNGATWSKPVMKDAVHRVRNHPNHTIVETRDRYLIQTCNDDQNGVSPIYVSRDSGETWIDPAAGKPGPRVVGGGIGSFIAGVHGTVVQLQDGSLLAFGRGNNINGRMPQSLSTDMGATWTYSATQFPPVSGGQRHLLRRLREGPILLVSFTDPWQAFASYLFGDVESEYQVDFQLGGSFLRDLQQSGVPGEIIERIRTLKGRKFSTKESLYSELSERVGESQIGKYWQLMCKLGSRLKPEGIAVKDAAGKERRVYGMFAALSFDEGKSWPVKKLITPGGPPRRIKCFGYVEECTIDDTHAELGGILEMTQTPDGTIHLISCGLHYRFNLPWLKELMPAEKPIDRSKDMGSCERSEGRSVLAT